VVADVNREGKQRAAARRRTARLRDAAADRPARAEGDAGVASAARPRRAAGPRRLRDISYLYLSSRTHAPAGPPPARRTLRLGFTAGRQGDGKTDVCCNFAVQLVRLGHRTLVLDLDPQLPNAGFRLGLEPRAYMAHLRPGAPQVERALLGLRVVEGLAAAAEPFPEALLAELAASDCVLVNLPVVHAGAAAAIAWFHSGLMRRPETTMAQVAQRSPMFGAWLESAPRSGPAAGADAALDALVFVHDGRGAGDAVEAYRDVAGWMGPGRVRLLVRGEPAGTAAAWACVQPHGDAAVGRGVLSSLYPEHPAARTYQGLVQSLLAAPVHAGGARV